MDRLWRQLAIATNWPILLAVIVLSSMGIFSIWAHANSGVRSSGDWQKQALFLLLGLGCMFLVQGVSYVRLGQYAWPFYLLSLALLVYTVLPGMPRGGFLGVVEANYARAWINLGYLNLQPAELMKVAFCAVMARYLRFRSNYRTFWGLLAPFSLAAVPLLVILKQPDLGTALVFIPALFAMLFVAGARKRHLLAVVGMGLMLSLVAWFSGPAGDETGRSVELPVLKHLPTLIKKYQRERVYAMFSADPRLRDKQIQQEQALITIGSGGATGRGAGAVVAGRNVPEAHNDMVYALIAEQFGFIGSLIVLGAYLVLFTTGIEIAAGTREPFGKLMAVGIVSLFAGQAFLNLAVALRIMPVTGVTLPFVSYGGSSLLASCIAAGLLLNIGQNRPLVMARDAFEF